MPRGGKRPGAGRKPGSKTKKMMDIAMAAAAAGETPLEYLLRVMRDPTVDEDRRMDEAKSAAPYVHARLNAVAVNGEIDNKISRNFALHQSRRFAYVGAERSRRGAAARAAGYLVENATLETGLDAILAEALAAAAGSAAEPAAGYSALEIATLALRWLGEGMFERGDVELMRSTLDAVCRASVRHLATEAWVGIGTWPAPREAPPNFGPLPY
jgi:hypothetical protein